MRDVVGLYLNPPDHAVVLSVDEKSQIQALNRTSGIAKINRFTQQYKQNCRPFAWTATADSIFKKRAKLYNRISGTAH